MKRQVLIRLTILFVLVGICSLGALSSSTLELEEATATPASQVNRTPTIVVTGVAATTEQPTLTPTRAMVLLPTNTPMPPSPMPTPPPTIMDQPPEKEMVLIPGAEFMMGSDNSDPDKAPPHSVSVAPFEMDKTEVTNAEFAAFVEDTGYETEVERCGDIGS
jgi:formylglycine-generating enzyme required for sulfatase activity